MEHQSRRTEFALLSSTSIILKQNSWLLTQRTDPLSAIGYLLRGEDWWTETVRHVAMILIHKLSKNPIQRGVQWTYLMNESWKTCFFFSHTLPHLPSHCFSLSSFLTSTSLMTAPLAGTRWLPINNSHITQVQRGEPDEPPAGAHLLSTSLWPVGVPDARHSFRESVAWLMHVVGLGLVSVQPWAAYLLQGFHMFFTERS